MAINRLRVKVQQVQNVWQSPGVSAWRHSLSPARAYRYWTAERRRLPDFIIAGAQKAGTTSLFEHLAAHPGVMSPLAKELAFFDCKFHRGMQWYRLHFPLERAGRTADAGGESDRHAFLTGESSSYYIFHPLAPERIAAALPKVKIIFLLRNPVDRAFSHYQHKLRRAQESLSFEAAIEAEAERLAGEEERIRREPDYRSTAHRLYSYLSRGKYVEQIRRWEQFFPRQQMLVLESSDFFKRTADAYRRVLSFLNLPEWRPAEFGQHFAGGYRDKMSESTRRRLVEYFAPHNEELYAHLGRRFAWA